VLKPISNIPTQAHDINHNNRYSNPNLHVTRTTRLLSIAYIDLEGYLSKPIFILIDFPGFCLDLLPDLDDPDYIARLYHNLPQLRLDDYCVVDLT
jgi:hypothetical protein